MTYRPLCRIAGRRRAGIAFGVVALFCIMLPPARAQRPERPRSFAIENARIVPVSGPVIKKGTVVIADGLIVAVGRKVSVPPDAWVIDGSGLTVYPGLIDGLTTLALKTASPSGRGGGRGSAPQRPQRAARGPEDRTATTSWVNAADGLKADDKAIAKWREGGFTTVVTSPANGIFPGQAAIINLAGNEPKDLIVRTPVALRINLSGAGFRSYPGSLMGVIAYVRQLVLDADHYAQAWQTYEAGPAGLERPEYDRTLAPLANTKSANRPVLLPGNLARQINRAAKLGEELGLRTVVYGAQQGYEVASGLAGSNATVLVNLDWPKKPKDGDPDADTPLRTLRFRDRAPSAPSAFDKAGVKFAFYSGKLKTPKAVFESIRRSLKAGLSPEAALRALTLSAAEIYGVADRLGSVDPGKIANLVVTDGDLFDKKTKIKMVFVDGKKFEIPEKPKSDKKGDDDDDDSEGKPAVSAGAEQ